MTARIILVRHGPSAHLPTGMIDRAGVVSWLEAYDVAGIQPVSQPPAAVLDIAARATHIVASDLRRAIDSAEKLAPGRSIRVTPLLREAPLDIPRWPTRLPVRAWGLLMYGGWIASIACGRRPDDAHRDRADSAVRHLAGLCADGSSAVAVTHGVFRRLLGQRLVAAGWRDEGRQGGYRHWSAWTFSSPA